MFKDLNEKLCVVCWSITWMQSRWLWHSDNSGIECFCTLSSFHHVSCYIFILPFTIFNNGDENVVPLVFYQNSLNVEIYFNKLKTYYQDWVILLISCTYTVFVIKIIVKSFFSSLSSLLNLLYAPLISFYVNYSYIHSILHIYF